MRFPQELQCLAGVDETSADETSAISAKEQSKKGEKDIPHKKRKRLPPCEARVSLCILT